MIKNILYSLFLHATLAFFIYVNFRQHIINEKIELKEGLSVSMIALEDLVKTEKVAEKPQEIVKKEEPVKPKPKPAKAKPIKPAKPKPPKPAARPPLDAKPEFKKAPEIKEPEIEKKIVEEEKPVEPEPEPVETAAEETEETPQTIEDATTAPDVENLQLSMREKFNIQSQLKACYNRALHNFEKSNVSITVQLVVLQDGTIEFHRERIVDEARYNNKKDTAYRNRVDAVLQALELCSPLRNMLLDKYDVWREFTIEFGGS